MNLNKVLRDSKYRLALTIVFIIIISFFMAHTDNLALVRENVLNALKSIAFLFALISALSLSMYNNNVNGLKEKYISRLEKVRSLLESLYELCDVSKNENKKKLNNEFTLPLIALSERDWLSFDVPNEIRGKSYILLEDIHKEDPIFLPRYMQRIEDEINSLGVLFIRRILVTQFLDTLKHMIFIIATGMVTIVLFHLLPSLKALNFFLITFGLVVSLWAILGTLLIGSYLYQDGLEEGDEIYPLDEDQ